METLAKEPRYQDGGIWMLVEIDISQIRSNVVEVNVSLPAALVNRIDSPHPAPPLPRTLRSAGEIAVTRREGRP